ncbi:hypothetical protein Hanom_Chr17g01572871 [Helianthus anomalus]
MYKPQFPQRIQIPLTLDPEVNTGRYKLKYKPQEVMKRILLMKIPQDLCGNMMLWCYDSDTSEAIIVFKEDALNFQIFDCMWLVMSLQVSRCYIIMGYFMKTLICFRH